MSMKSSSNVGSLMCLYMEEIDPGEGTNAPEFLIKATAAELKEKGGRNWVPAIVRQVGDDAYTVIGNSFIYAVAEEAGLERIWCVIADNSDESAAIARLLSGEEKPKINLSLASRDEILAALKYLIEQPNSALKSVKLSVATTRIDEAPRQYWKNLDPIASLKCGITRGKKLDALKQVFYLTPQPLPETITDARLLETMSVSDLKAMAKKRGVPGISKMSKKLLVEALSEKEL